jgi:hypothetical protein
MQTPEIKVENIYKTHLCPFCYIPTIKICVLAFGMTVNIALEEDKDGLEA